MGVIKSPVDVAPHSATFVVRRTSTIIIFASKFSNICMQKILLFHIVFSDMSVHQVAKRSAISVTSVIFGRILINEMKNWSSKCRKKPKSNWIRRRILRIKPVLAHPVRRYTELGNVVSSSKINLFWLLITLNIHFLCRWWYLYIFFVIVLHCC